jgi:hypothetical protein
MPRVVFTQRIGSLATFLLFAGLVAAQNTVVDPSTLNLPNPNPIVMKVWGAPPGRPNLGIIGRRRHWPRRPRLGLGPMRGNCSDGRL